MKEDAREELQKEYVRLSFLREKLNSLLTQQRMLEVKIRETESSIRVLNELNSLKKNEEILSSVGSNVFLLAKIADKNHVLVNVGADTVVKKSVGEAIGYLEERLKRLRATFEALRNEVSRLTTLIAASEGKLSQLAKEVRGG